MAKDEDVAKKTGDIVRRLRREQRWTAQHLSDECVRAGAPSLSRSTIAKIESGVRKSVTSEELVALARALRVPLEQLIESGDGEPSIVRPGARGPGEDQGIILVSIGSPSIKESVKASLPELSLENAIFLAEYLHEDYIAIANIRQVAQHLRDQARGWANDPRFARLHLFYRGPVALGPLLGAVLASGRPIYVYHHEGGRYELAYPIDRQFLVSTSTPRKGT
ncbi:SAVED domain-containing protein [Solwaraspora sp. WMMA2101]|uniref:SAVED domain-containing protein n=1 Tax=Solwaraspora sp. WMMA2101 TaxID=3404124 RepID=UPI003B935962